MFPQCITRFLALARSALLLGSGRHPAGGLLLEDEVVGRRHGNGIGLQLLPALEPDHVQRSTGHARGPLGAAGRAIRGEVFPTPNLDSLAHFAGEVGIGMRLVSLGDLFDGGQIRLAATGGQPCGDQGEGNEGCFRAGAPCVWVKSTSMVSSRYPSRTFSIVTSIFGTVPSTQTRLTENTTRSSR